MTDTSHHDQKIAEMTFGAIYPHYLNRVERRGRSKQELDDVIEWLTGFGTTKLGELIEAKVTFKEFFAQAKLNPNANLIKGVICGYRVEDITNPLTQQARYLDKLVDELARGKKMENILRTPKN